MNMVIYKFNWSCNAKRYRNTHREMEFLVMGRYYNVRRYRAL